MHIAFEYPYVLVLLLGAICFWYCPKEQTKIKFARVDFLPHFARTTTLLPIFIYVFGIIALASPFTYTDHTQSQKNGRDLVLALDASGSMDFSFGQNGANKFDTLIDLAHTFVAKRGDDNIGITAFGAFAYTAAPITYDVGALGFILDYLDVGVAGNNTAIGEAIAQSVVMLQMSGAKSKVLILITDGEHNSGSVSPKAGVEMAQKAGVRIYTVGIGNGYDKKLFAQIASDSGGRSFEAHDEEGLKEVFQTLDGLEPSPMRSPQYRDKKPLFVPLLLLCVLGILILLRPYWGRRGK